MMKNIAIMAGIAAVMVAAVSCKSEFELLLESYDEQAKFDTAFDLFNQGKYTKAAQLFESLSVMTSGSERDDTVQYYWGLCNYRSRDYLTAETNFSKFISDFPRSPFTKDASFLHLDCLFRSTLHYELDQTPTYTCIAAINQFLIDYPESDKKYICDKMLVELGQRLDKKAYENARLYYKMEDYKAARVALKNVLKDDAENIYREDILYHIALASYKYADNSVEEKKKERFLEFIDDYYNFVGEYPESSHRKELDALYRKVKEK